MIRLKSVLGTSPRLTAVNASAAVALAVALTAAAPGPSPAPVQEREAEVAPGAALGPLVERLTLREQVIAEVGAAHFADPAETEPEAPAADEQVAYADAARITGLVPQVPTLAEFAAAQSERMDELTRLAEGRAATAERAIRRVGLNPRLVVAKVEDRSAQGGPLDAAADGAARDPGLAHLAGSVARMSALENGLDTIPTHLPASLEQVSSSFGYRSDPFTGGGAMHAGIDFRGPIGAPIAAAADGVVSFAGVKGGYGKCIEITHGNGMMTRYAHMSSFKARAGQKVAAGEIIGAIGNTGRSTGPHLHFEVRVNGAAVNPRPFLNARA